MKKILFLILTLLVCNVMARSDVQVINREDIPIVSGSGKPLTADQVQKLIRDAGKAREWQFANGENKDSLIGTLWVRQKHMILVRIDYTQNSYSISYVDSSNMNAKKDATGKQLIHPKYNEWVNNFMSDVRKESGKF